LAIAGHATIRTFHRSAKAVTSRFVSFDAHISSGEEQEAAVPRYQLFYEGEAAESVLKSSVRRIATNGEAQAVMLNLSKLCKLLAKMEPNGQRLLLHVAQKVAKRSRFRPTDFLSQRRQPGITSCPVRIDRVPPAPFRSRLIQLNLEGRIRCSEILRRVGHVFGGTAELAQLKIGYFAQTCADSFYIFRVGLSHVS
jgi:hypothetical protein